VQDFDPSAEGGAPHAARRAGVRLVEAARARLRFHQRRPDLRPAQADARILRPHAGPGGTQLRPDRIALYAYAHLPERFKPQRRIVVVDLPNAPPKVAMLSQLAGGFRPRAMCTSAWTTFALPNDALAVAKRQGRLHRNFQGYSTQPDCDLIGLGVSAIGRIGATYSQNAKTLEEYYDHSTRGACPWCAAWRSRATTWLRRAVIMALMCQGEVLFEPIELAWLIDFRAAISPASWKPCAACRAGPGV
jgi:oxygen-independent coproporphyrinogen-3 oxidase